MQKNKRREQEIFLENISRKVWMQLSYANAVEQSLYEGSLRHLILEEIDKKELQKLEDMAKTAAADIDDMIADASSLGFEKTVKYLGKLKKKLPGNLSLVKLVLKGDAQEAAKEIGKVTSTTTTVNNIRDSFYDAVVLFGTELAKLPYAQDPESVSADAAAAAAEESESGEVEVADGKTVPPEEATQQAVAAFKEQPIEDIASNKFMTWAKGIKFPDSGMLQKAAQNSYKEPPKPKGFLGKVASFFGFGDLTAEDFADDLMKAKLSDIIEKSKELAAKRAEAQKEEEAAQALAGELAGDMQSLAQGDSSALAVAAGQGDSAGGATGGSASVQMAGVGAVPAAALPQVMPGQRIDSPDDTKGKEMVSMDDLERKVTAPEDVPQMTDELAALINDDPKSDVVFFSEEEAEEAVEEAPAEEDKTKKEWVYKSPLSTMLFESRSRRNLSEAIMYKDVQKAIIDQGVEEGKVEALAVNLADRLKNQYNVIITGMPTGDVQQASQAAAGQSDQLDKFLGYLEKRDAQAQQQFDRYMDDVGMSRKDTMEFTQAVADGNMKLAQRVAKDAGVSAQKAFDTAAEMGAEFEMEIEDEESAASSASSEEEATSKKSSKEKSDEESQTAETSDEEETKEKKKRVSGPPTSKMKERGEAVGVKPKKGESGQAYGARVRREEEKQGKRVRKTKTAASKKSSEKSSTEQSSAKKTEKSSSAAKKSGKKKVKARGRAAIAAAQAAGFGRFSTNENAYYKPGMGKLTEALLGPNNNSSQKLTTKDDDVSQRWRQLAGLEEK